MNKKQLLALDKLSEANLAAVQTQDPALFREMQAKVVEQRKTTVEASFAGSSTQLREHLARVDFSLGEGADRSLKQAILESLKAREVKPELAREAAERVSALERSNLLADPAYVEVPLADHPLFQAELRQATVFKLAGAARLPDAKTEVLLGKAPSAAALSDEVLGELVKERALEEGEAKAIGLTAGLFHLADEKVELADAMAKGGFPSLPDGKISELRDLAALRPEDWEKAIESARVKPPEGMTARDYAEQLGKAVTDVFVTDAVLARVIPRNTRELAQAVDHIGPLVEKNPLVVGRPFDSLDLSGIHPRELPRLRAAHDQLRRLANRHPGLGLHQVLSDKGLSPAQKLAALDERIGMVDRARKQNPDAELLMLNYAPGSQDLAQLDLGGLEPGGQRMVVADLKAYQRSYALTGDVEHSLLLLDAGYPSGASIASKSLTAFQADTGLSTVVAKAYYDKALGQVAAAGNSLVSIVDLLKGGFDTLGVGNLLPSTLDYLKQLDGYADLFGSQDYCNCEHCQSILSPAAYFVDLMCFVEENVLNEFFTGPKADHVLNLKVRRPDLWKLPLTCENTTTLIPYLEIINEILENYIARRRGFAGDFTDRRLVEDVVYRQAISNDVDSLRQPFWLPLARLNAYLAHFDRTRGLIALTLAAPPAVTAAATLKLSRPEYDLVVTPNANIGVLRNLYGVQFVLLASGKIQPFDAQEMLKYTGLSRTDLGQLSEARFVTNAGAQAFEIKAEKSNAESVQNDIERIHNLTPAALDRMHRFVRLWRALKWSIPELDLVLAQFDAAALAAGIGAPALEHLVSVLTLLERFRMPVDQNCALWSEIPRTALDARKGPLFDRLFNFPPFTLTDGLLPKDAVKFIHPAFREVGLPLPADNTLPRLLAGLRVNTDDLAQLITQLSAPLGVNLGTVNEADRGFFLTVANLTRLYRHARLSQLLKLPVADLFQLIRHAGIAGDHIANLPQLPTLLEFRDWWKASGFKLDDLGFITRGLVQRPEGYPDKAELASQLVAEIGSDKSLEFADTVFAFLPGVTEEQSRAILEANPALLEPTPSGTALRLTTAFDPAAPLVIPLGVSVAEPDAREVLLKHHTSGVLAAKLAARRNLSVDKVVALVAMTGVNLASTGLVQALHGGSPAPLVDLLDKLLPLTVLFRNDVFDPATLDFVRLNAARFAIADFNAIAMESVRKLAAYVSFTDTAKIAGFTAGETTVDAAAVRQVLAAFDPVLKFANSDPLALATALRTDQALLATLLPNLNLPDTAPEALAMLGRCVELAEYLGIGGESLKLIISEDYAELTHAAEAALSAFRAKYSDEKEFLEKLEPYEDGVRSRKRDALADYMIRSIQPEFDTIEELYQYFLVDVRLEGCARTSRLVAAISSVQLYVHRILLNLEQDRRDEADPNHLKVRPDSIPADEWVWRKNYRVWEANRKVFLWPENYIEPELRDDKTPLFEELESTLLQQQVNEQNVLDAYTSYLNGFDQISKLRIAGSFHDKHWGTTTDTLHLFGVSPGDPPTYYYRTIENAYYGETESDRGVVYTPWRKIDVQIPVRRVAPVVHLGRLFVFWVELTTTPKNEVKEGGSQFVGYKHRMVLKYTLLRLDGRWTPPQKVSLSSPSLFSSGDGIISDPLAEQAEVDKVTSALLSFDFPAFYDALAAIATPKYDTKTHGEPLDDYTLTGFQWEQVYPQRGNYGSLTLTGRNFIMRAGVDFYQKVIVPRSTAFWSHYSGVDRVLCSRFDGSQRHIYYGIRDSFLMDGFAECSAVSDERRLQALARTGDVSWLPAALRAGLYQMPLARIGADDEIAIINGSLNDAIIDSEGDLVLLQGSVRPGPFYLLRRIGTTLGERLSRILFTAGVNVLLDIDTQKTLGESSLPLTPLFFIQNAGNAGKLDFKGAFGTYYREIFFHIPFLIANQLNSQQRFAAAQRWYHYIFDPTSDEHIVVPSGLSAEEKKRRRLDRVWRYLEFRNLDVPTLRDILTDPATIEVYKKDPFNPHAIARLRLSAYQKCIVMKYIDNLLDWGDSLFAQFTMESVNEATLLYVMAADILGPRPAELGSCGEGAVSPKNYETIAPLVKNGSEFLAELETWIFASSGVFRSHPKTKASFKYTIDKGTSRFFGQRAIASPRLKEAVKAVRLETITMSAAQPATGGPATPGGPTNVAAVAGMAAPRAESFSVRNDAFALTAEAGLLRSNAAPSRVEAAVLGVEAAAAPNENGLARPFDWKATKTASWSAAKDKAIRIVDNDSLLIRDFGRAFGFHWSFVRQLSPVFCVPPNKDLRAYWDRVEDRLYKIRHCLDISGVRRQLALFAPEIDPRLLVRARALGLSIEDVLNAISGNLPPYRFTYLIEKAKQYAMTVQGFGAALMSALEKKDMEELNRLRTMQQQNLLKLTTRVREWEIDIAADGVATLDKQIGAVEYRKGYYEGLIENDLSPNERAQQITRHIVSAIRVGEATLGFLSGVLHLIPQVGSPFAMKYGGMETGKSIHELSVATGTLAAIAEAISASAGLEAGFQRREEGWEHQVELAEHELKQLTTQREAAELRKDIAVRSLDIHNKSIEQLEEIFEFYRDRFTNLGLYTYLSTTLQRVYREAYNSTYAIARLAEQAFRFERGDETTVLLQPDYWDPSKAGLMAGERLIADLLNMERRFLETNFRTLEVDQSFSLTQIAPAALLELREEGVCDFDIPELAFDLFYPGQYRRRIKAVRLTIPCVTGPYTNVSATLTLTDSHIRNEPKLGSAFLVEVPPRRSVSIATSTAQNDSGVFEFSFRDERYMPFEGAGAVSSWKLQLPKSFRQFDYQTINDAIVHVSYTAEEDGLFRDQVEAQNASIEGTILNVLSNNPLGRVFSLRQDFSSALSRLLHSVADTPVKIHLTEKYLPVFLRGRNIDVTKAILALKTPGTQNVTGFQLAIDGANQTGFARDPALGNLWAKDLGALFAGGLLGEHTLAVKNAGVLAPASPPPGDVSVVDADLLLDALLYVEYQIS